MYRADLQMLGVSLLMDEEQARMLVDEEEVKMAVNHQVNILMEKDRVDLQIVDWQARELMDARPPKVPVNVEDQKPGSMGDPENLILA